MIPRRISNTCMLPAMSHMVTAWWGLSRDDSHGHWRNGANQTGCKAAGTVQRRPRCRTASLVGPTVSWTLQLTAPNHSPARLRRGCGGDDNWLNTGICICQMPPGRQPSHLPLRTHTYCHTCTSLPPPASLTRHQTYPACAVSQHNHPSPLPCHSHQPAGLRFKPTKVHFQFHSTHPHPFPPPPPPRGPLPLMHTHSPPSLRSVTSASRV